MLRAYNGTFYGHPTGTDREECALFLGFGLPFEISIFTTTNCSTTYAKFIPIRAVSIAIVTTL
jgi:hypothetical protein